MSLSGRSVRVPRSDGHCQLRDTEYEPERLHGQIKSNAEKGPNVGDNSSGAKKPGMERNPDFFSSFTICMTVDTI